MPNDNPLAELSADELTGPNHLCRTLIPSDAVVAEIRRRLERLAIVETELATAKSDRRGLLGLVRAQLECHWTNDGKMHLLELTNAVLDRLTKCEAALLSVTRECGMHQIGLAKYECVNPWCKAARAALEGR